MPPPPARYENYPWTTPLLENGVWLAVYVVGFRLFMPFGMWAATAYLGYSIVCLYLVVPGLVCTHCVYYGRTCHSGQGRLAALLFPKRDTGRFVERLKCMRFAAPVFLAPLIAGIAQLVLHFSWERAALTIVFGILSLGCTGLVTLRLGCPHCAQRSICPGARKARPE